MEVSKKDWLLFREKIGNWQEVYMEMLIKKYADSLADDSIPASTRFWELNDAVKEDRNSPGVRLELSKGNMIFDIVRLMNDKVITFDDLQDFSDDTKDAVRCLLSRQGEVHYGRSIR